MVFIWGSRGYYDQLGYVIHRCPECGTLGPFSVEQTKKKFTVYFIPTFSYSQKQYLVCTTCQAAFEVNKEAKEELARKIMSQSELSKLIRQINEQSVLEARNGQVLDTQIENVCDDEEDADDIGGGDEEPMENSSGVEMKYCPYCKTQLSRRGKHCPECGESLSSSKQAKFKYCPNCSVLITRTGKFCSECGARFNGAAQ